jgi:hypothetical protein
MHLSIWGMNLAENPGARGKPINPVSQCKSNKNWTLTKKQRRLVGTSQVPGEGIPRNKSAHKEHDYQRFAPIPKAWAGGANQHMTNHKQ